MSVGAIFLLSGLAGLVVMAIACRLVTSPVEKVLVGVPALVVGIVMVAMPLIIFRDAGGGFERRCVDRGGQLVDADDAGRLTQLGAHGPVVVGYPVSEYCLGPAGEVLGAR